MALWSSGAEDIPDSPLLRRPLRITIALLQFLDTLMEWGEWSARAAYLRQVRLECEIPSWPRYSRLTTYVLISGLMALCCCGSTCPGAPSTSFHVPCCNISMRL